MKNVVVAFKWLHDYEHLPKGWKEILCQIIYDVKLDLTRQARLVAGGQRKKSIQDHLVYSSVAFYDNVRLVFILAGLNKLKLKACDIENAYLNAPNKEKITVTGGKKLL